MDTQHAINVIADFIRDYAITLAALGALTMALIEAVKKVFGLQPKFHRNAVEAWLQQHTESDGGGRRLWGGARVKGHYAMRPGMPLNTGRLDVYYDWRMAYAELLCLTTGLPPASMNGSDLASTVYVRSIAYALFELELPKLMSQVQEAADAALSSPDRYPHLFSFFTRGAHLRDVRQWLHALPRDDADSES